MNDSKDYVDGGALYQKALNRDFRRLLNEERFFKFIDREDDHNDVRIHWSYFKSIHLHTRFFLACRNIL